MGLHLWAPLSLLVGWYDNPHFTGALLPTEEIFAEYWCGPGRALRSELHANMAPGSQEVVIIITTITTVTGSGGSGHHISVVKTHQLCDLGKCLDLSDSQAAPQEKGTKNVSVRRPHDEAS